VTGEAAGGRFNVVLPAGTKGGTICGLYGELYANDATSDLSQGSIARFVLGGDPTGIGLLDTSCALFSIEGVTINTAKMVRAVDSASAVTHQIRIRVNGTNFYLMAQDALD
jgi:hypothetical protein